MGEMVTEALTYLTIFGKSAKSCKIHVSNRFDSWIIVAARLWGTTLHCRGGSEGAEISSEEPGNSETEGMAQEWCRNAAKLVGIILRWSKNHQTWGIYNWSIRIWIIHGWNWRISSTIHFLISILLSHDIPTFSFSFHETNRLPFIAPVKAFHLFSFQYIPIHSMAFCSLFSPKKLGISVSKFSPFLVPCCALQHFGLLPWWLKRPTIVWRRMQRRMRRITCWNIRPSKWTRRTCRWKRDLADLYWFMVEQLVI